MELPHRWHRSKTGSDFGWYRFTIPGEKLASTEDTLALDLGVIGYSSWWEVWRSRGMGMCGSPKMSTSCSRLLPGISSGYSRRLPDSD